ncbi:MAG: hypothetical protein ACK54T_05270 [bacterium]|jgi:hypothetical protein
MDKIKIQRPLCLELLNKSALILFPPTMLLAFLAQFYSYIYTIRTGNRPGPMFTTAFFFVLVLLIFMFCIHVASLVADFRFCKPVWRRIKEANGQECPGCQYPGTVEVGGKCTECGMDFTAEIVERWRQWWSADSMPPTLPASGGEWWAESFRALVLRPIQRLRQTRLFSSRSKPRPGQPTPEGAAPTTSHDARATEGSGRSSADKFLTHEESVHGAETVHKVEGSMLAPTANPAIPTGSPPPAPADPQPSKEGA